MTRSPKKLAMPSHITRSRGKPKQCAYCERVFTKEEHLKRHERSHTGERPFKCHKCGRSYARSDVLFRHSQSHSSASNSCPNQDAARPLSSVAVRSYDDNNLSGHKQIPVVISPRRQPSASSSPGSDTAITSSESQIESNPHDAMEHLAEFVSQNHCYDNNKSSCYGQEDIAYEVGSSPPHKKQKLSPQSRKDYYDGSVGQSAFDMPQTLEPLPPSITGDEVDYQFSFGTFDELDMFFFEAGQGPILGNTPYNFHGVDSLDLDSSAIPSLQSTLMAETCRDAPSSGGLMTISEDQMKKVQRIWSRQRPKVPAQITNRLWSEVINHNADNIFSTPQHGLSLRERGPLKRNIDQECRNRLLQYCKTLDDSFGLSCTATDNIHLPTIDILDSSLDFYFQFFHPILPIIHKSTFDARNTPNPLLLAMCLVGLSYLDRAQTKAFLIRYLKRLLPACLSDLTSHTLSGCAPSDILTVLATVLIVAYLALGFRDEIDVYQAYMLCNQTLCVADKRGLFTVEDGDHSIAQLRQRVSDPNTLWKAWGRVESIKRLICCLIYLDMAYARLMSTSGVIEMDKVDIHLPCDDRLFDDATTAAGFLHLTQQGIQMTMPRMNIRSLHRDPVSKLNHNAIQVLLRSLYLRVIAAKNKHSSEEGQGSSPVERLAMKEGCKDIVADIILLPKTHTKLLHGRNQNNALGWHYLCILLTADVELLETACGRDGLEAAEASLARVFKWAQSSSARRALLHAAQVFNILNLCRIRESYLTRPDLVLFVSALVISQYFLVTSHTDSGSCIPTFELLQDLDWTIVGDEGLGRATGSVSSSVTPIQEWEGIGINPARDFLKFGGPASFAGEAQGLGGATAKKIARKFAHLMDGFGKWDGCSYSQLVRAMCGFTSDLTSDLE